MKFTKQEINLARKLKQMRLQWKPSVGHYVWDEADVIKCASPFHDMVFFILDLKHFLRRSETIEQMQRDLCWLPTWYDAREILKQMSVNDGTIAERLRQENAVEDGSERLTLYRMIEEKLACAT